MTKVIDIDGHGTHHEMFAYISIDQQGQSGICAATTEFGLVPLVGMTRKDMKKYEPYVESIRAQTEKHVLLVKYLDAVVLDA